MSGAIASSFPNRLFGDYRQLHANAEAQEIQNQYAPQAKQLAIQTAQQQLADADTERVARLSQWMLTESGGDEGKMASLYADAVANEQRQGRLLNAPAFPGAAGIRRAASLGTPSEKLGEQRGVASAVNAINLGTRPNPLLVPGTTTPGATTPASLPIPPRGTGGPGSSIAMPPELLAHFREASAETGIPMELLIAQARQESGFRMDRPGQAGEIGIMQIKPSTARDPGGMPGVDPAVLSDPRQNILFGARYLRSRMQGDPNDPAVQAAALRRYNGGGDPDYVAHVNQYRPGFSPTDPAGNVTTYTPQVAPQQAPGAPGAGRVQVASVQPTVATDATTAPQPPQQQPPVQPPQQQQQPQQQPQRPAATLPPELQTNEAGLTTRDLDVLVPLQRLAATGNRAAAERFQNEIQQRQTANRTAQQQWQTRQDTLEQRAQTAQQHAETQRLAQERFAFEQLEAAKGKTDADRIRQTLLTIGPKIRDNTATPEEAARYAYDWNQYAYGDVETIPNPDKGAGGTVSARVPRNIRQDLFPPPPGQTGALQPQIITGTAKPPDMAPAAVISGVLENAKGQAKIAQALASLSEHPESVGAMAVQPNWLSQRTDPQGVKVRADVSDVQGHIFHDLAGTAQSGAEAGRLKGFTPDPQDTAEALKTKLQRMLEINRETMVQSYRVYGPEGGYRRQPVVEEAIIGTIPQGALDALRKDPELAKQFDRKYGKGTAKMVLDND